MNKVLALRLYKSFLRESRNMIKKEKSLWLNMPPDFKKFQTSVVLDENRRLDIMKSLLPSKIQNISCHIKKQYINGYDLKHLCNVSFREQSEEDLDAGFEAFRILRLQVCSNV